MTAGLERRDPMSSPPRPPGKPPGRPPGKPPGIPPEKKKCHEERNAKMKTGITSKEVIHGGMVF